MTVNKCIIILDFMLRLMIHLKLTIAYDERWGLNLLSPHNFIQVFTPYQKFIGCVCECLILDSSQISSIDYSSFLMPILVPQRPI